VKILLFGRDGQLGTALSKHLQGRHGFKAYGKTDADLRNMASLRQTILQEKPRVIFNAAAYTAVDQAESDIAAANLINGEAPGVMAAAARAVGALLVHYSTDYVFDGRASTPYTEDAPTHPLGVYGKTKLAGEQAIRDAGGAHLIIRTAWLYSSVGKNFLRSILRLAQERDELQIVNDQTGSPTYAAAVAAASLQMLPQIVDKGPDERKVGTFHMTCQGAVTWYSFANKIIELSMKSQVKVKPITTTEYPTPARRPAYSVLDNGKLARVFGITLPHWEQALKQCMMDHESAK
jgi:dTDP-4-dehydrorhamnose reductase